MLDGIDKEGNEVISEDDDEYDDEDYGEEEEGLGEGAGLNV